MHNGHIVSKKKSELARTQKHLKGHLQPKAVVYLVLLQRKEKREREEPKEKRFSQKVNKFYSFNN